MASMVRKKCNKCQKVSWATAQGTLCKRTVRRMGSLFYCHGDLTPQASDGNVIVRQRPTRAEKLAKELAHAHENLEGSLLKVRRAVQSVTRWQKQVRSLERRLAKLHEEEKPTDRARTRLIHLPPDEQA